MAKVAQRANVSPFLEARRLIGCATACEHDAQLTRGLAWGHLSLRQGAHFRTKASEMLRGISADLRAEGRIPAAQTVDKIVGKQEAMANQDLTAATNQEINPGSPIPHLIKNIR
jgi:hypothetical protein